MEYNYYLEVESKRLARLLVHHAGQHLLQLSNHYLSSLEASPILHKICIDPNPLEKPISNKFNCSFLRGTYTHLPFANESMNLVILPHTLEIDKNVQPILTEAWRVLSPNGHLVVLGINPTSLWGLYRLFSFKKNLAWDGYFHTLQTVCQWIYYLGGKIQHIESFLFRPPLSSTLGSYLFRQLSWLERISPWLIPYMGGIYLIIANKQVRRLNKLELVWQFPPVLSNKTLIPNTREAHRA